VVICILEGGTVQCSGPGHWIPKELDGNLVPLLNILDHLLFGGDGDGSSFIEINSHTIKILHLKCTIY